MRRLLVSLRPPLLNCKHFSTPSSISPTQTHRLSHLPRCSQHLPTKPSPTSSPCRPSTSNAILSQLQRLLHSLSMTQTRILFSLTVDSSSNTLPTPNHSAYHPFSTTSSTTWLQHLFNHSTRQTQPLSNRRDLVLVLFGTPSYSHLDEPPP